LFEDDPRPLDPASPAWRRRLFTGLAHATVLGGGLAACGAALGAAGAGAAGLVAGGLGGAIAGGVAAPAAWLRAWAERRPPTVALFFGVGLGILALSVLAGLAAVAEFHYARAVLASGSTTAGLDAVTALPGSPGRLYLWGWRLAFYVGLFGLPLAAERASRVAAFAGDSVFRGADGAVLALAGAAAPLVVVVGILLTPRGDPARVAVALAFFAAAGTTCAGIAALLMLRPLREALRLADRLSRRWAGVPERSGPR